MVNSLSGITTNEDLLRGLLDKQDSMISFLISFLLLCFYWSIHVRRLGLVQ